MRRFFLLVQRSLSAYDLDVAAVAPVSAPAPAAVPVEDEVVEAFAATGLDDALELLETITAKTDKAAVGTAASGIERHPERRFKVDSPKLMNFT